VKQEKWPAGRHAALRIPIQRGSGRTWPTGGRLQYLRYCGNLDGGSGVGPTGGRWGTCGEPGRPEVGCSTCGTAATWMAVAESGRPEVVGGTCGEPGRPGVGGSTCGTAASLGLVVGTGGQGVSLGSDPLDSPVEAWDYAPSGTTWYSICVGSPTLRDASRISMDTRLPRAS